MRHYLFLSAQHAVEKYVNRGYDQRAVTGGWHGWRAQVRPEMISLPPERELRESTSELDLDFSNPRTSYLIEDAVASYQLDGPAGDDES